MPDANGVVEIKDFSLSLEPKKFRINDDVFLAIPQIPLGLMSQMAKLRGINAGSVTEDQITALLGVFDLFLFDESAVRMRVRADSKTEPVGITQMMNIISWLLEEYGLRPQTPSSASSTGSSDGDGSTPSTDGAPVGESTGYSSQLIEHLISSSTTSETSSSAAS